MKALTLPAFRIQQTGSNLYLTRLRAGELTEDLTRPDAWGITHQSGYQRAPQETRFKKIAQYLEGKEGTKPLLPNAVVLNARRPVKFVTKGSDGFGELQIPADALPLWEVDGQHRIGGVRRRVAENPEFADYELPVVIVETLSRLDEAVMFFVMNTRQIRVPTDLAQRLITQQAKDPLLRQKLVGEGKAWIEKATEIVDILNETPDHPWYQHIGIPGMKLGGVILRQTSFVQSLRPLLAEPSLEYHRQQPEPIAKLLIAYWQSLRDVFPAAFDSPDEYVIQKTVGVFPLHTLAPHVFREARAMRGGSSAVKRDAIVEVLEGLAKNLGRRFGAGEPSTFWHRVDGEAGKYAGAKGFKILADILIAEIPTTEKLMVE